MAGRATANESRGNSRKWGRGGFARFSAGSRRRGGGYGTPEA